MQHSKGVNGTAIPTSTIDNKFSYNGPPHKTWRDPTQSFAKHLQNLFSFSWTAGTWKPALIPLMQLIVCNLSKFENVYFLCHHCRNLFRIKYRKSLLYSCEISKQRGVQSVMVCLRFMLRRFYSSLFFNIHPSGSWAPTGLTTYNPIQSMSQSILNIDS